MKRWSEISAGLEHLLQPIDECISASTLTQLSDIEGNVTAWLEQSIDFGAVPRDLAFDSAASLLGEVDKGRRQAEIALTIIKEMRNSPGIGKRRNLFMTWKLRDTVIPPFLPG
jgi:alpha-D-ribose 1-methylphosphonate 5-triphosphate synthase subunit PhnH